MVENENIWSSPEESMQPSLPITSLKIKQIWMKKVHSSILDSGLLLPSIGLCKSAKYA